MAKITLLDGNVSDLSGAQAAAVIGAKRMFADKAELEAFLQGQSDLTGVSRPSRFEIMARVQQRMAERSGLSAPA